MNTFIYEGRSGPWLCTIFLLKDGEDTFSAVVDIACTAWIEQAERT